MFFKTQEARDTQKMFVYNLKKKTNKQNNVMCLVRNKLVIRMVRAEFSEPGLKFQEKAGFLSVKIRIFSRDICLKTPVESPTSGACYL